MKKIYTFALGMLLLTTPGCEDFLERYPDTAVKEELAMTDLASANEVVIGIYSCFKNAALYSGYLTLGPDVQSDLVYAVKGYTNAYGELYRWQTKDDNTYVKGVYGGLYQVINRTNFFLDNAPKVASTLTNDTDRKTFNKLSSDAYFARALAYADLIRTYCEAYTTDEEAREQLGVSLYLTYRKENGSDMIEARASLYDSYQQVLSDLNQAETLSTRVGADTPFFTKGAIAALKARVYLYMRDWKKAAEYASEVIDAKYSGSPIYKLAEAFTVKWVDEYTGNYMTDYQRMWKYDQGEEVIWRVAFSSTDRGGSLGRMFLNFNGSAYYPDYVPAKWLVDSYASADYRYSAFFYEVTTGYQHGLKWPMVIKYLGNADIDAGVGRYYTNMPKVLRLSETYLIRAEAYAMLGETSKANADLTTLRKARIQGYGAASHAQSELMAQIKTERAKELFMEGFRLSDLKRWGDGFTRTPQTGTIDGSINNALKVAAGNNLFTWPIPKHELDAGMGIVKPNPSNNN